MATVCILPLLFLALLSPPPPAAATLHSATTLHRTQPISDPASLSPTDDNSPTTYFEVRRPIPLPNTKPCSYLLLRHDFGFTYGQPPVLAQYTPPADCRSQEFSRIVLEWSASCQGRQFDRIFGIWLGGVEILRSCTAEPRATGTVWTVKKDITRYSSLLVRNQTLAVYLGNVVNRVYTGVYHVNVSLHFYPAEKTEGLLGSELGLGIGADLILPISRTLPLNDGLWFEIQNSMNAGVKQFSIPPNAYRAVLEVYVSFHENDEFWFGNFPNEYIAANNLSNIPGNGPFREVVVSLDDLVVGAVWPFTVIYTGGVNPLLWRPITGIGSFDLPSYDIEITPLLGKILDGKSHTLAFRVTNALNVWYIDANLHLWLDRKSGKTQGKVLEHKSSPLSVSFLSNFTGLDGLFVTNASRSIVSRGWVKSSHGTITTRSVQGFMYTNSMELGNDGNLQILNQAINFNGSTDSKMPSSSIHRAETLKSFSLYLHSNDIDKGNGTYESVANLSLGVDETSKRASEFRTSTRKLKNVQNAQGYMLVKGNLVVDGLGSTQQEYQYTGDESCYFRNVSSSNYTILHDEESKACGYWKCLHPHHSRRTILGEKKRLI